MMTRNDRPIIGESTDAGELLRDFLERTETTLEPIEPERTLKFYFENKLPEYQAATVRSHCSRLGFLIEWYEEQGQTPGAV